MSRKIIRSVVAASLLMSLTSGCAVNGLLPNFGGTPGNNDNKDPGSKTAPAGEFKSKLANLEFKSISQTTQNQLDKVAPGLIGNTGSASNTREGVPAPNAPTTTTDPAQPGSATAGSGGGSSMGGSTGGSPGVSYGNDAIGSPVSSSYAPSIYNYGYYFSGPFGPMKLDKLVEATTAGSSGGWQQIRQDIIDPVLNDWAPDAGLISSGATLDENGDPLQGQAAYPGEIGWRLAYAAPSIREAMYFLVTPAETKVVRMRWIPVTIDSKAVKVDAKSAIDLVRAGIRNAGFKSLEDLRGFGFFYPKEEGYGAVKGMPVPMADTAMASAPSRGGVASPSGGPSVYYQPSQKEEELYELQAGGRWNANLSVIGDYTLWELNYYAYYGRPEMAKPEMAKPEMAKPEPAIAPMPPTDANGTTASDQQKPVYKPEPYTYTDNYVYAYVDAKTGDVIRLRRPRKVSVTYTEQPYPNYDYAQGGSTGAAVSK